VVLVAVSVGSKALELASSARLEARQPAVVAVSAIAAVLVLLAVHTVRLGVGRAGNDVAACRRRVKLEGSKQVRSG